jgi:cyclohexa-1,5-dienecarbonyl-CoA hydratase
LSKFSTIELENKGGVARITLNRPPANVLNIPMMKEIVEAVNDCSKDPTVNVLVFDAKGKLFSGGVDVADHTADKVDQMTEIFHKMCSVVIKFPQPTIAVLNGQALGGGCELAIACDMIIASETAKLGQPEIKLAVFPPIAAIMLPRLVGRKKALELILTGDVITAKDALTMGLVNQVVPPEKLEEAANTFIGKLASLSGLVLKITKKATFVGLDNDYYDTLSKVEGIYLHELMKTKDAEEGLKSFIEKRQPKWQNK